MHNSRFSGQFSLSSQPTTTFIAMVEPFTDIHLWLLPIAKNMMGQPRVVHLSLHCTHEQYVHLGVQGPSDFSFSFLLDHL